MIAHLRGCRKLATGVVALVAICVLPAAAWAESLYFRNDAGVAIILQGSCVIRGRLVNDRPNLLQPGDKVRVVLPGNKLITIREARAPNKELQKTTIPAGKDDVYILITPDPPTKVKLERTTAKEFLGGKK
jgi:hypothetical protein